MKTRRSQYHVNGIPEAEWAAVRAKAGARLAEGLKTLICDWAHGRVDPLVAPYVPLPRAARSPSPARQQAGAINGRLGGLKRATTTTAKRRAEIATQGGQARRRQIEARRAAGLPPAPRKPKAATTTHLDAIGTTGGKATVETTTP